MDTTWYTKVKVLAVWFGLVISFMIFQWLLCSTAAGERQERQHEQRLQEAEQQLRAQGQVSRPLQQDTLILIIGLKIREVQLQFTMPPVSFTIRPCWNKRQHVDVYTRKTRWGWPWSWINHIILKILTKIYRSCTLNSTGIWVWHKSGRQCQDLESIRMLILKIMTKNAVH